MPQNKNIQALLRQQHQSEEGLSLVELLIAITILAIVVLFSSNLFVNSFRTSATMENRSKALQIAQDVIAVGEQSPYRKLYTPRMSIDPDMFNVDNSPTNERCQTDPRLSSTDPTKFGGTIVKPPTDYSLDPAWSEHREFKGLIYCQKRYFGQENAEQVGTTFYVQTDIIFSSLETSDTPSRVEAGGTPAAENIKGKRIVVTVRWKDTHSGESDINKIVLQQTVLPNAWDCPVGHVTPPPTSGSGNATQNGLLGC